jgi:hypothetical protein
MHPSNNGKENQVKIDRDGVEFAPEQLKRPKFLHESDTSSASASSCHESPSAQATRSKTREEIGVVVKLETN